MGDANITRDQFSEFKADGSTVLRKIVQQNTYIADADANEIGQIAQHRSARSLWNLLNRVNSRFGAGWFITGGTNQVTVSAGDAAMQVETDKAHMFHLGSNTNVTGWTTPSGSGRTDYLYLDVELPIIDSADDATLVNPAVGKETAVDQRLKFIFVKQIGGSVPSAPANHYYITIATITRYNGQATINNGDITNSLTLWSPLHSDGHVQITGSMAASSGVTIDGLDLSAEEDVIWVHHIQVAYGSAQTFTDWDSSIDSATWITQDGLTEGVYYKRLRISFVKKVNYKKLKIRYEGDVTALSGNAYARWTVTGLTPVQRSMTPGAAFYEEEVDISTLTNGTTYDVLLELYNQTTNKRTAVRKVVVTGTL